MAGIDDKIFGNLLRIASSVVPAGTAWLADWRIATVSCATRGASMPTCPGRCSTRTGSSCATRAGSASRPAPGRDHQGHPDRRLILRPSLPGRQRQPPGGGTPGSHGRRARDRDRPGRDPPSAARERSGGRPATRWRSHHMTTAEMAPVPVPPVRGKQPRKDRSLRRQGHLVVRKSHPARAASTRSGCHSPPPRGSPRAASGPWSPRRGSVPAPGG